MNTSLAVFKANKAFTPEQHKIAAELRAQIALAFDDTPGRSLADAIQRGDANYQGYSALVLAAIGADVSTPWLFLNNATCRKALRQFPREQLEAVVDWEVFGGLKPLEIVRMLRSTFPQ